MAKIRSKEISTLFTLLIASHVMLDAISLFVYFQIASAILGI